MGPWRAEAILLADDSELVRDVIGGRLSDHGATVVTATCGDEALGFAESADHPFDLIILDIMMPDMSGYEVTRILRSRPKTRSTPILLLTALDGADDKVEGLAAGADDFLSKSVSDAELIARVRSLVALGRLRDTVRSRREAVLGMIGAEPHLTTGGGTEEEPESGVVALVHPNASVRTALLETLQEGPYAVRVLDDPASAIRTLERSAFDVLVAGFDVAVEPPYAVIEMLAAWDTPAVLIVDEQPTAARRIASYEAGADDYVEVDAPVAEIMARVANVIVRHRRYRLIERVKDRAVNVAIMDPVTGLFNRAYLEQIIEQEVLRTQRYGDALGLIMFDLDHFKAINDTFGHAAGDRVLRQVGSTVLAVLRSVDVGVRYGGDEFVVVLPHTDLRGATRLAERLRQEIAAMELELAGSVPIRVTASMGVAAADGRGAMVASLLGSADQALYAAKRAGRDRVVCSPSPDLTEVSSSVGSPELPRQPGAVGPAELSAVVAEAVQALGFLLGDSLDSPLRAVVTCAEMLGGNLEEDDPIAPLVEQLGQHAGALAEQLRDLRDRLGRVSPFEPGPHCASLTSSE